MDTNIVMGGLLNPCKSYSGHVLALWGDHKLQVLVSRDIQGEYLDVLGKMRFGIPRSVKNREESLKQLLQQTQLIVPDVRFDCIPEDPTDNRFLECAVTGGAHFIVTNDRHLLDLNTFQDIAILTAGNFIRQYRKGKHVQPASRQIKSEKAADE